MEKIDAAEEQNRLCARDRVLLYTSGMGMDALESVALALESMRRAGKAMGADNGPAAVQEELYALLREKGCDLILRGSSGEKLRSAPYMNRRHMVAENMDSLTFGGWLKKIFRAGK